MEIQLFELLGFELPIRELPIILEINLLTPKNICRGIPEKLANFSGSGYIDQIKSEYKVPINYFHYLTEVCAGHTINLLMLARELRTADDLKKSFEIRFTMLFDLYMIIALERRLRRAYHLWPRWPRVRDSKCFDFYDSSTLFAMLEFCGKLEVDFGVWLFYVSNGKVNHTMMCEVSDLKFVDWICKISNFKEFFSKVGSLNFPEVVSAEYDLKAELSKLVGRLRFEHEEMEASLTKIEWSFALSLAKWATIFDVGINKIRQWRDDGTYYFDKRSARKWALPITDLPAEYLEKYREQIDSK